MAFYITGHLGNRIEAPLDFLLEGLITAIRLLVTGDSETFSAVFATLKASGSSMAASLVLGIPAGFMLGYYRFKGHRQVRMLVDTLLALPTVLIGLLVYAFLTRNGPLGEAGLLFTIPAIAIGQTILALPIVIALTASAVEGRDSQLGMVLMSLGADRRQILLTSLWEVRYGVAAAAVTACGRVLTEVGISMMIGGNIKWHTRTVTTAIALETSKGQFGMGIALGLILLIIAFLISGSVAFFRRKY